MDVWGRILLTRLGWNASQPLPDGIRKLRGQSLFFNSPIQRREFFVPALVIYGVLVVAAMCSFILGVFVWKTAKFHLPLVGALAAVLVVCILQVREFFCDIAKLIVSHLRSFCLEALPLTMPTSCWIYWPRHKRELVQSWRNALLLRLFHCSWSSP